MSMIIRGKSLSNPELEGYFGVCRKTSTHIAIQMSMFFQMLDTDVFHEINVFGPNNTPTPDLIGDAPPTPQESDDCSCCPRLCRKKKSRAVSINIMRESFVIK